MALLFTLLSIGFVALYATEHNCDMCSYRTIYNNQSWLDKKLVKKVKNEKASAFAIKLLLGLKANSNAIGKKGETAFSYLLNSSKPSLEKINIFLEQSVDCNKMSVVNGNCTKQELRIATETRYPLEYISQKTHNMDIIIPIIKLLLQHNADPNKSSIPVYYGANNTTLLHNVVSNSRCYDCKQENIISLIKIILSCKADVNIRDSKYGDTPFHNLCTNNNHNELIKCFLEARADANIKNYRGTTPFGHFVYNYKPSFSKKNLMYTINENKDLLDAFIEHKADLTFLLEQSLREYNILEEKHGTLNQQKMKFILFLLEKKADLNVVKNIKDILLYKSYTPEVLHSFLERKMNPTIPLVGKPHAYRIFAYQWTNDQDKRNVLAYAIPSYIKEHYMQTWKTLLLCLNAKRKSCLAFKIPRYLNPLFCGDIGAKINKVMHKIKELENVTIWDNEPNKAVSLRNNICGLINMHNKIMQKTN